MFDSIDWLEDGVIDGKISSYGGDEIWMGGLTRP
jgi:hypothetical protein